MIVNFMKNDALDMLIAEIPNNVILYNAKDKWIDEYFENKGISSYYFNTGIMVPDVELTIGDSKTDYENAVKIYEAFKGKLSPVQASDLRLWAYLAHNVYWDYMRVRWAVDIASNDDDEEGELEKLASRVGARYFYKASKGKAFVRQGIARLYWSAYLTYDEDNADNPYELTEYFLSKQDIFAVSTERSLARNKKLLLAALRALKDHGELKRAVIRQYFLRLNQAGGVIILDSLSKEAACQLANETLDSVIAEMTDRIRGKNESKNENTIVEKKIVRKSSKITAICKKKKQSMIIAVNKKQFQTKPDLVGLTTGDIFKIRKDTWEIIEIK